MGTVLILGSLGIEAYHYPWGMLFGTARDASSIPAPTPIVLKGEDKGSNIIDNGQATAEVKTEAEPKVSATLPGNESDDASPPSAYVVLGTMKIPKLNVSQFVLEGTQRQLKYGLGHVSDSEGIGQLGNCDIAGHRSAAFRYLNNLVSGDIVVFEVNTIKYTYTVYQTFSVLSNETWVLGDVKNEKYALTLITCTPYLIYSHRLVVRARLTDINGMTPEKYYVK